MRVCSETYWPCINKATRRLRRARCVNSSVIASTAAIFSRESSNRERKRKRASAADALPLMVHYSMLWSAPEVTGSHPAPADG